MKQSEIKELNELKEKLKRDRRYLLESIGAGVLSTGLLGGMGYVSYGLIRHAIQGFMGNISSEMYGYVSYNDIMSAYSFAFGVIIGVLTLCGLIYFSEVYDDIIFNAEDVISDKKKIKQLKKEYKNTK